MEGSPAGGGGPAPFLLKTYEMVDDSSTDEIVSWSSSKNSFVVWNPPEFARILLPAYFKHNNFSSFIRQLNTYGFRKIDPERWEFANEEFVKDQKHLLKNIHRRKPIHSHSQPQGSAADPERAAFEEEIDKLSREKTTLENNLLRFKQQSAAKPQLEDWTQRVTAIELRQESLLSFLEKVVQNQNFVEQLSRKLESMDFSAYNKKRRLSQVDYSQQVPENSFVDNQWSSRPDFGNIFPQDFSNKLRLELSPSVSDINFVSHSTQSSNENGGSPQRRLSEGYPKDAQRAGGLSFASETLELSDTGTSFTFNMDSALSHKAGGSENPRLLPLQQNLTSNEEVDGHLSCHLNLTLASSSLQVDKSQYSAKVPQQSHEIGISPELRSNANDKEDDDGTLSSSQEAPVKNQGPATSQIRVNDVFWEQFLTERPGISDAEEASSSFRENTYDDQEDRQSGRAVSRNGKNTEHLTL
ncbi:Heat stress transcription factor A-5 like [Actinidia chinensis var. chinensis]|uniref:Heat stress transcription factor n=1 Tax=Actinidia chinensis var. chinensis TaxID=1590841 RepID=A0A2R6RXQ3_ACTCC|nr:Heat stress transcription factor A-5 like [Actinidia chinensis var. chinensis]